MTNRTARTTLSIPAELRRRARIKAIGLDTSMSAVVRELLERWIAGEIRTRQEQEEEQGEG